MGGSSKSKGEQGIQEAGSTMYSRGQATPEETAQYQGSFDIGKLLQQIMQYQQGMGQAPQGYMTGEQQYQRQTGPLGQAYYNQTLQGVQDPYKAYESQLQPALQLASQQINQGAAQRGLLRSGIPIEQMGRAGVDLAIKEAQDRMNFRGQELARGGELTQYSQGLGQQNLTNLSNLYGQQQQFGLNAMGRQAGQAQQAATYQAYPGQAALGSYYGGQAALQALPGQLIGAAGTAAGAMINPYGTALGAVTKAGAGN
jgi:hypothetical protein